MFDMLLRLHIAAKCNIFHTKLLLIYKISYFYQLKLILLYTFKIHLILIIFSIVIIIDTTDHRAHFFYETAEFVVGADGIGQILKVNNIGNAGRPTVALGQL